MLAIEDIRIIISPEDYRRLVINNINELVIVKEMILNEHFHNVRDVKVYINRDPKCFITNWTITLEVRKMGDPMILKVSRELMMDTFCGDLAERFRHAIAEATKQMNEKVNYQTFKERPAFNEYCELLNPWKEMVNMEYGLQHRFIRFKIKKVIFNDPATIVYWTDGSKTVVKCQEGDTFDKEKGLAMAISKYVLGNAGNYNDIFKEWIKED